MEAKGFIEAIEGEETPKARAMAIRDEFAQVVTVALSLPSEIALPSLPFLQLHMFFKRSDRVM